MSSYTGKFSEGVKTPRVRYIVINLARAPERRAHMERELARTGVRDEIEFFPALDGQLLKAGKESGGYSAKQVRRLSRWVPYLRHRGLMWNEAACFLSHKAVWRQFLEDKENDFYVVLEDDAYLHPHFAKIVNSLVEGQEVDLVRLNTTQLPAVPIQAKAIRDLSSGFQLVMAYGPNPYGKLIGKNALPTRDIIGNWLGGVIGYLLSRKGATALLAHAENILRPLDHHMMRFWEYEIPPMVINPHPVCNNEENYPSTIGSASLTPHAHKERYMVLPFYSASPRNLACRGLQIFLRRRDVLRYRRYIGCLMKQFGAPDLITAPPRVAPFSESDSP